MFGKIADLPKSLAAMWSEMESAALIRHWNQDKHVEEATPDWLPSGAITVGITAGASCPNNLIEDTILRLFELHGIARGQVMA